VKLVGRTSQWIIYIVFFLFTKEHKLVFSRPRGCCSTGSTTCGSAPCGVLAWERWCRCRYSYRRAKVEGVIEHASWTILADTETTVVCAHRLIRFDGQAERAKTSCHWCGQSRPRMMISAFHLVFAETTSYKMLTFRLARSLWIFVNRHLLIPWHICFLVHRMIHMS